MKKIFLLSAIIFLVGTTSFAQDGKKHHHKNKHHHHKHMVKHDKDDKHMKDKK